MDLTDMYRLFFYLREFSVLSAACALGAVLLAACGCDQTANKYDAVVTGTVTINGELARSGSVTFHPVAKDGMISVGRIFPDGSFSMRTGQGNLKEADGGTVPSGEYDVVVSVTVPPDANVTVGEGGPPIAGASLMHSRYGSKDTSGLRQKISPGDNIVVLNLEPAEPQPPADGEAAGEAVDREEQPAVAPANREGGDEDASTSATAPAAAAAQEAEP